MGRVRIKTGRVKTAIRLLAGLLIGGAALAWAASGVDPGALWPVLRSASPGRLLLTLAAVAGVIVCKAARWQRLYPAPRAPVARHLAVLSTAMMLNLLIPVRTGELLRLGLMKAHGRPATVTLSTLIVEKTIELTAAALIAAGLFLFFTVPAAVFSAGFLLAGPLLAGGLWLIVRRRRAIFRRLAAIPGLPRSAVIAAQRGLDSLAAIGDRRALAAIAGWTGLVWLLSLLATVALLAAFNLRLPPAAPILLMLAVSLSNVAPSPPAQVGLLQGVAVAVLQPFGVPPAESLAVGLTLNIAIILPPLALGLWGVWRQSSLLFNRPQTRAPNHAKSVNLRHHPGIQRAKHPAGLPARPAGAEPTARRNHRC